MTPSRLFVRTLQLIALFQLVLGLGFLFAPGTVAALLNLNPSPSGWVRWLFAMMAARFLGYAWGMWTASQRPAESLAWIDSMIAIQAIDWVATVVALARHSVRLSQVTTASFMPVIFIAVLARERRTLRKGFPGIASAADA